MPVFSGAAYQRGYGVGRVMKNMIREATPLLKHAGKQAVKTGLSVVASSILGGKKKKKAPGRRNKAGGGAKAAQARRARPTRRVGLVRKSPTSQTGSGKMKRRKRKVTRDIFFHK